MVTRNIVAGQALVKSLDVLSGEISNGVFAAVAFEYKPRDAV